MLTSFNLIIRMNKATLKAGIGRDFSFNLVQHTHFKEYNLSKRTQRQTDGQEKNREQTTAGLLMLTSMCPPLNLPFLYKVLLLYDFIN